MGKLYLIPTPLGENEPSEVLPSPVLRLLPSIRVYVVEEIRTARRFLSRAGLHGHIEELEFHTLNEHTDAATIESYVDLLKKSDVGLISEAGLPAVADPGAALVALAHRHGIEVVPFVGPSSLMLALMASGLNGQSFAFNGYLPAKTPQRRDALKSIEKISAKCSQSQIFIETPYRNDAMLSDILSCCADSTRLTIAADITLPTQTILTRTVGQWKKVVMPDRTAGKEPFAIGKRPCVFIILA